MNILVRVYMNGNLGDDLFVYLLCKRYPNTKFFIIGEKKYSKITDEISNLHFIASDTHIAKLQNKFYKYMQKKNGERICNHRDLALYNMYAKKYDDNIFVTGSFFIQNPEWDEEMEDLRWYDTHPHILGCNFGPYYDDVYLEQHKIQFAKCKEVVFRESFSYELFQALPNVSYAPDLVFSLEHSRIREKATNDYIISVVNLAKDHDEELMSLKQNYIEMLVEIVLQITQSGNRAVLMSFCSNQGDDEIIEQVISACPHSDLVQAFYYRNEGIEKSLETIKSCKGIVASRYHAMILGFLFGKKVLPISYSKKMDHVLSDIHYQYPVLRIGDTIPNQDIFSLFGTVSQEKLNQIIEKSQKHFTLLDKQLQ